MLSNLFDSRFIAEDNKVSPASYLRTLKHNPTKKLGLLAVVIFPGLTLGWWFYSLAMAVGVISPMRSAAVSSDEIIIPDSHSATAIPEITKMESADSTSSATSNSKVNLNIDNNTVQSSTVEIDGQSVPVPTDGSSHQVIQNDNGKTTIDINVDSDTSGTSNTRSSTSINLRSSSSADLNRESEENR